MADRPLVYLAGPITGSHPTGNKWREYCRDQFAPGIGTISPLRQHFETIDESQELSPGDRLRLYKHGKAIAARDRFDVKRCDVLLVNLVGAKSVSIGSVGEIFWADAFRKPVVLARERGNIHTHAMLDGLIGWEVETLEAAVEIVRSLLS